MSEQDVFYAKEKELRSLELKVVSLETENRMLKSDCEKNIQDHKEYDKRLSDIDVNQGVQNNSMTAIITSLNEMRVDLKTRDNDTLRSYNSFKWALALSILTTVIGFFVNIVK